MELYTIEPQKTKDSGSSERIWSEAPKKTYQNTLNININYGPGTFDLRYGLESYAPRPYVGTKITKKRSDMASQATKCRNIYWKYLKTA